MSLEQLPPELVEMVLDNLDGIFYLRMRRVSRTMATLSGSSRLTCTFGITPGSLRLTLEFRGANIGRNQQYFFLRSRTLSTKHINCANVNGLEFWLQKLRKLSFDKMEQVAVGGHISEAITALEPFNIQQRVEVAIKVSMYLGSPELAKAMKYIQNSRLNLAISCRMIAPHSFQTQRSRAPKLIYLGKVSDIHIQVPVNRMVSDRLVFEDGCDVDVFKITNYGDNPPFLPSLWNLGAMVDLFSNCNNVRIVELHNLTITVDIPLLSANWSLSSVQELILINCNFRMSNRARRKGSKEEKGSLSQAGCFMADFEVPGMNWISIDLANFVRYDEKQQLELDHLQILTDHNEDQVPRAIVMSEAFKASSVRHLRLHMRFDIEVLRGLSELKNLQTLFIRPPHTPIGTRERDLLEANVDEFFAELDQKCPSIVEAYIADLNKAFKKKKSTTTHQQHRP